MPTGIYKRTTNKGWIKSEETKRKLSEGHKGLKYPNRKSPPPFSLAHRKKIAERIKGKEISYLTRKKLSDSHKREKCHFWKGGITSLNRAIRTTFEYRQWRCDIFTRDDFACQECEARSGKGKVVYLEAHHIKEFNKMIEENKIKTLEEALNCEELWNINNGITLCRECHKKTDTYGWKKYNNKKQIGEGKGGDFKLLPESEEKKNQQSDDESDNQL